MRLLLKPAVCSMSVMMALVAGSTASAQCTSQKITADDAAVGDYFGHALALDTISGSPMLAVGCPFDTTPRGASAGSVYVYMRSGSQWSEVGHIWPNDLIANDEFGYAVAFDDPYLIAGTPGMDSGNGVDAGAVYIYERSGLSWTNKGRKVPLWTALGDRAGTAVDITAANGGWAVVGAPSTNWDGHPDPGYHNPDSGAAYIYQRTAAGEWNYVSAIWDYDGSGSGAYQYLGEAVAIDGDVLVVAAPNGKAPGAPDLSGYIKIFRRGSNGWTASGPARFSPPDAGETDLFGFSVDTDGTYIAVGSLNHDSTAAETPMVGAKLGAGCVYVYRWNSGTSSWDLDGKLFAQDAASGMQLGGTVKISGGKVFAATYSRHRIYQFRRVGAGNWVQEAVYHDPEPGASTTFAGDFAVAGTALVVSDKGDTRGALTSAGAAHAFTLPGPNQGGDTCSGAKAIAGGEHSGCTSFATVDGFSNCGSGGGGPGPDVWYAWTPACSGNIIIDTFGSDFDTVLSVHSACPEGQASNTIVCNDDANFSAPNHRISLVTFDYTAGQTYLIRISGFGGASGNYTLRVVDWQSAPTNNACSSPATATAGGTYTFRNCKATTDGPLNTSCNSSMTNDVWYVFTSPADGVMRLNTCGSTFDTILAVYPGGACPTLATPELACNDDAGAPCIDQFRTSFISHEVTAGASYLIRVGGYNTTSPTGDGVLNVNFIPSCPCDWNQSGQVSVQDIFDFLASYFSGSGDFNQSGQTSVQDIFDFLACYFSGC